MSAEDLRAQRNRHSEDNIARGREVMRMMMRKSELGPEVAAAQNLRRLAAEAEVFEAMKEPTKARELYHDLAAGALARAQLISH